MPISLSVCFFATSLASFSFLFLVCQCSVASSWPNCQVPDRALGRQPWQLPNRDQQCRRRSSDNKDCGTNATSLNSWVLPKGSNVVGTLQIFGDKCLDVTNGANTDGTKLQIWTCAAGNTNQMWIPAGPTITWSGKNKCVDVTNGNITDGNQIQIWDCDVSNNNQNWNNIDVTIPKSFVISLKRTPPSASQRPRAQSTQPS
ncbi:ricin B lectin domain-containing protein [Mycena leptocephala]|nr:ricin B lectin domain-containing protein [Mycena leptocephala]